MLSSDSSCLIAAWLSILMGTGSTTRKPSSRTSSRSPSSSRPTCDADVNSASIVESDTPVCFLQIHCTTAPSIVTTPPVTDFLSLLSAAKSASLQLSKAITSSFLVGACMVSLTLFVPFKYLATLFTSFQSLVVGWCVLLVALCTAKLMSGLVHRAIQSKLPTSDWKRRIVGSPGAPTLVNNCGSSTSASLCSSPTGTRTLFAFASPCCSSSSSIVACWSSEYPSLLSSSTRIPKNFLTSPKSFTDNTLMEQKKSSTRLGLDAVTRRSSTYTPTSVISPSSRL
ncbi:uncharacterized protein PITG_23031 [Phytophthora infestans T30-4]|uniref:Transmembrane protein n=1 Tax=Phytophthora infestans (strain T30-4) TaxID=403677 RepID=D0NPE4_PHYIT|nr:uncharacterized protein PITG_23031 [Phytophthora infestans T30-4]EEY62486.1 conserved hypothetical protein [Phytophthora infestans T30-4]|eukprot:XP_002899122.1 conserved hypothetical protein [Phytophthora infestans T30-4]